MGLDAKYRTLVIRHRGFLAFAVLAATLPVPALACRLALLLALDVSTSVDAVEDRLQREGLAAALLSPEVRNAALGDPAAPVALAAFEWSGAGRQYLILNWRLLRSEADLVEAATRIRHSKRVESRFPTALGLAVRHAVRLFDEVPVCQRRTLDVSGDGINNLGPTPAYVYRTGSAEGLTVNALVIGGAFDVAELERYFQREVIRGPGAFVEVATDYQDYARAMQRKLERELAILEVGALAPQEK